MLRDASPIFDTPEIPSLRRTRPLPKRRRTSESLSREDANNSIMAPVERPSSEATHESSDKSVGTEPLQQVMQSYYIPMLGGTQDLLKTNTDGERFGSRDYRHTSTALNSLRSGRRSQEEEEEDNGEEDFLDKFQQPGNTKKRKVPANLAAHGPGHELNEGGSGEDEPTDRAILTGRLEHEYDVVGVAGGQTSYSPTSVHQVKNRMSRATLAGLQHKEMLNTRKRQLAAVLGALTHGDSLALDQALSANYPLASSGLAADLQSQELVKVRLSRRPVSKLSRAFKAFQAQLPLADKPRSFPQSLFTFMFHSKSKYFYITFCCATRSPGLLKPRTASSRLRGRWRHSTLVLKPSCRDRPLRLQKLPDRPVQCSADGFRLTNRLSSMVAPRIRERLIRGELP